MKRFRSDAQLTPEIINCAHSISCNQSVVARLGDCCTNKRSSNSAVWL